MGPLRLSPRRAAGGPKDSESELLRRERSARIKLLEAEAALKEAEVGHRQLEDTHLEFDLYRKTVCLVLAVIAAVIVIARLWTEPSLDAVPGSALVALLGWLGGR